MATTESSIIQTSAGSSGNAKLKWSALATAAGRHIDVSGIAGDKMILLVAHESTVSAADYVYIGTCDSAVSATAPYSAGKLGRLKIEVSSANSGTEAAHFRTTGSTNLVSISALGPFETARFKDADGQINICKAITGSSTVYVVPIGLP
jgi:hypothetical protein